MKRFEHCIYLIPVQADRSASLPRRGANGLAVAFGISRTSLLTVRLLGGNNGSMHSDNE